MASEQALGRQGVHEISALRLYLRALGRDWLTLIAVLFLLALFICMVAAPLLAPHDPLMQNLSGRRLPPFSTAMRRGQEMYHLLGTDELGRDILSRLMHGARVSMAVALTGVLASGLIGVVLGLVSGYYGGWLDDILMRTVDAFMALPSLLLALFLLALLGGGFLNLVLIFAILKWTVYARLTRSLTITYRDSEMVTAARAIGATDRRILFRHILPNLFAPLLVLATLEMAALIIAEASLSFLGLGIQPPQPTWGGMISRGRGYLSDAWWIVALPGFAILLTTLSLNILANWLRNVTDPVQSWRWLT
ncbi:MAG: ABC transporter permease [Pararhodobacter sp.]|nr:ABC transporter permease [Pararhodobacter sp.]